MTPQESEARLRADIHDGWEQCSNTRPNTLMQDRSLPTRQIFLLRTAGPYIGSEADIRPYLSDVRFTPKSRHCRARMPCPLCANSGLMHCTNSRKIMVPISRALT